MIDPELKMEKAEGDKDYEKAKTLFKEYAESLSYTLDIHGFQKEIENLPGEYAPPDGFILLAYIKDDLAGCVALKRLKEDTCEMLRMFVRPDFRQRGIGRAMAEKTIDEARKIGYKKMWLDMVESMKHALGLYQSMGFVKIKPFREKSRGNAVFLELDLE